MAPQCDAPNMAAHPQHPPPPPPPMHVQVQRPSYWEAMKNLKDMCMESLLVDLTQPLLTTRGKGWKKIWTMPGVRMNITRISGSVHEG